MPAEITTFTKEITCKKCGKTHDFILYPVIDFQNTELAEKTFSLELFNFVCPDCQAVTVVQYDTVILDLFKKNIIYLYANTDSDKFYAEILPNVIKILDKNEEFKKVQDSLKHTRLVNNLNSLLEILLIFDYDLDDRIIEFIKFSLFGNKIIQEKEIVQIYFDKLKDTTLCFTCISKNPNIKPTGIGLDIEIYNNTIDKLKLTPEESNLDFSKIDFEFLEKYFKDVK